MKTTPILIPALLGALTLVMSSCSRIEQRTIGENQCVLVKKIRGQEKMAFPAYPYFPCGDKKVPDEMFMYDDITHDKTCEDLYIARIGNKKWALDGIGRKLFEEPLLEYEFLGWGITNRVLQTEYEYYRFTTEKGVYFGTLHYGWENKGPYEDIFMLGSGAFLYKENGKWSSANTPVRLKYDALIDVSEITTRGTRFFFLAKEDGKWKAVDYYNKPVSLSQKKIKEYLQVKPNASGYIENSIENEIRRQRIGNDVVGYIIIQDAYVSVWK